ncbi:MAG: hypothetical protein ABUL49_00605 [bacterium]
MVGTVASIVLSAFAAGGFVTPRHVITQSGLVWPLDDMFHSPMSTPHPQGARVLAAAGTLATSAYLLMHDRNIEILIYGGGGNMKTFNQTDAPREMTAAGTLKMWAFNDGQYLVQSDSQKAAWVFDPVKYWQPTTYSAGLAQLTPYGQAGLKLLAAKAAKAPATPTKEPEETPPATPADPKDPKEKKPKPKMVTKFVYVPIESAADATNVPDEPTEDSIIAVELPDGLTATGVCQTVTPGYVVLYSSKRAFVYSLADKKLVSEVDANSFGGSTLAFEAGQCYAITFGSGGGPQVAKLTVAELSASK